MNLEFSYPFFEKYSHINFHENSSSGSRVVPCGETDRLAKLIVAFGSFANAPVKLETGIWSILGYEDIMFIILCDIRGSYCVLRFPGIKGTWRSARGCVASYFSKVRRSFIFKSQAVFVCLRDHIWEDPNSRSSLSLTVHISYVDCLKHMFHFRETKDTYKEPTLPII